MRSFPLLLMVCLAIPCSAQTWNVTNYGELVTAMTSAAPGDVIFVQPGTYAVNLPRLSVYNSGTPDDPITVRGVLNGGQRPVLDASGQDINRGIINFWPTDQHWVVENLEFRNAHGGSSYSDNAAAIYIRGDHITIRNCYSHHNDNGWFSTSESEGILLEGCETAFNGTGTGFTHNHYMNSVSITVRGCYVHDSVGGINYKDRSTHTVLEGNLFENAGGYDIDWASEGGGNALMIGNVIVRTSQAGNHKIVNIGDGTGSRTGTIALINNTIIAGDNSYRVFERHSSATATLLLYNNVVYGSTNLFAGSTSGWSSYPTTGAANWFPTGSEGEVSAHAPSLTGSLHGVVPGFAAGSYHLSPTSPCRDSAATAPLWRDAAQVLGVRRPVFEFLAPQTARLRPQDGALDRGAFEVGVTSDLAVGGSSSLATLGPVRVGVAGTPGENFAILLDNVGSFSWTFPTVTNPLCLSLAPFVVEMDLVIPASGYTERVYPLPAIPALASATFWIQAFRYGASGQTLSIACPSVSVVN